MRRNRIVAFAKMIHEPGINDGHIGRSPRIGWMGMRMASAMSAFASAPPNSSLIWKKRYISAIMIGMKTRYQILGNPPSRYWMTSRIAPTIAMMTQRMFAARRVLISVYEAYERRSIPVINRIAFKIVTSTIIDFDNRKDHIKVIAFSFVCEKV